MTVVRHAGGPVWREDTALDAALSALAPPSAPRTSAADILALGAATPVSPLPPLKASVTSTEGAVQGIAWWKVAAVAMVGATLGLTALRVLDDGPSVPVVEAPALGLTAVETAPPTPAAAMASGYGPADVGPVVTTPTAPPADLVLVSTPTPAEVTPAPTRTVATVVDTGLVPAPVHAAAPTPAPAPREQIVAVRIAAPNLDGQTRLRLAGGLLTAPRASRASVSSMGPTLELSVARLGPAEGPLRPLLVAEVDLGTQIPQGLRTAHFCGGAFGGAGFAIDGSHVRLELAWTGGARVAPDTASAVADQGRPRPALRPAMGPQIGVAIKPDQGPDVRFGATLQGTLEFDDAMAQPRVQPWVGVSAGIDIPVPSAG